MDDIEINNQLRDIVQNLLDKGCTKTIVGKVILGINGYTRMIRFFNDGVNFGIKPIKKIGQLLKHDVKIVFIDPEKDNELEKAIITKNREFLNELEDKIIEFLDNNKTVDNECIHVENRKNSLDQMIQEILDS